jgi:Short C-terminal domain
MDWILLFIIVFVPILVISARKQSKRLKIFALEEEKLKSQGWVFSQRHYDMTHGFIIVDENKQEIACFTSIVGTIRIFKFEDILSCEILKDGETTYRKSTSRTIGGALLGGVLFGGSGMVVGGLSGNTKKNIEITSLELKLVIRDLQNPNCIIAFFKNLPQFALKKADTEINKWKDIFSIIIDKVDKSEKTIEEVIQSSPIPLVTSGDIYEQLHKIADLKDRGVLTEEEFITQKSKILA